MATFYFNPTTDQPEKQAVIHAMLTGREIEPMYKKVGTFNRKDMFQICCETDKTDLVNEVVNSVANYIKYKEGEQPFDTETQTELDYSFVRYTGQPLPNKK
jgi:hypothetical protein